MVVTKRSPIALRTFIILTLLILTLSMGQGDSKASPALAAITPPTLVDQTPLEPLTNPSSATYSSRYLSGFGEDSTFTVFFENREGYPGPTYPIGYVSTTQGPTNFPAAVSPTNIADTHFLIKKWWYHYYLDDEWYAYRAWGSVGNDPNHHFYISKDLNTWTLVSTFTIANAVTFTSPPRRGSVYYGFHDVIIINNMYYAWGESNTGETMIMRSNWGGDVWEAFTKVGGTQVGDGPLLMPEGVSPTPTGSFFVLPNNEGYGKWTVPGDDSGIYLAVNTVANPSQDPGVLEDNFINPANWTWHDGTTGRLTSGHALLSATSVHDYREVWMVPQSDPDDPWLVMYTASFDGTKALGYATSPVLCTPGLYCMLFPIIGN